MNIAKRLLAVMLSVSITAGLFVPVNAFAAEQTAAETVSEFTLRGIGGGREEEDWDKNWKPSNYGTDGEVSLDGSRKLSAADQTVSGMLTRFPGAGEYFLNLKVRIEKTGEEKTGNVMFAKCEGGVNATVKGPEASEFTEGEYLPVSMKITVPETYKGETAELVLSGPQNGAASVTYGRNIVLSRYAPIDVTKAPYTEDIVFAKDLSAGYNTADTMQTSNWGDQIRFAADLTRQAQAWQQWQVFGLRPVFESKVYYIKYLVRKDIAGPDDSTLMNVQIADRAEYKPAAGNFELGQWYSVVCVYDSTDKPGRSEILISQREHDNYFSIGPDFILSADPTPIGLSVADIADIPEDEILNPAENMYMAPVDLNAEDVTADAADIMNNKYGAAVSDNNKNAYDAKKGIFDFTESNSADGEFFTGYSNKVVAPQPNYGSIKFGKNYIKALVKVNTTQEKVDAAAANKDDVEANPTVFTFETDKGGSVSMKLSDVKTPGEWEYFTAGIDILPNWRTYESRDSENAGKEKEAWLEGYENADDVKISGIYHKTADAAFQSITVSSFETIDEEYDADRANETIALIEKLGADSSAAQVEAARISYDKLTKAQKELVGEQAYARLAAAEEKVESDKQAAKVVAEMIAALGAKPDDAAVKAAREAYDKLTESQKKLVENINLLTEAENAIAAAAENVKKANAVIALINSLSKNPSKAKAAEARNAYNKLTAEQKAMVTNLNQLIAAEKKIAEASKPVVKKVVIKKGKKTVKKLTVRKKTSKLKLKAVVSGKNLTVKDKKVKWKTSNKKLATVKAGTVKLKKAGKVKITASCKGKKAVVTIKIKK